MAVQLPPNAIRLGKRLAAFTHEYKEKTYVNICKTYIDDSGELCRGKGLTIPVGDFADLEKNFDKVKKLVHG